MSRATIGEQFEVVRRACDRGQKHAHRLADSHGVDTWQHVLDELAYLKTLVDQHTALDVNPPEWWL